MIMAAGLGTRLLPLTEVISKPMVPIAGRPALEHLIALLARHGVTDLAANLHYYPDEIREHFGDGSAFGVSLRYVFEEELSGTAGGVGRFRDFLSDGTFLVMSGDALTDVDLSSLVAAHEAHGGLCTLAVKRVDNPSLYGVVVYDKQLRITGFQEKPPREEARSDLCSCGIYACRPQIFDYIPEGRFVDFARDVFPAIMADGVALHVWRLESYWNDVGNLEVYRQSNFDALAGAVRVAVPGDQARPGVWVGPGTQLEDQVRIAPPVLLGAGCTVGAGARLVGPAAVGDRCVVGPGAVIERSVLWADCDLGAGAGVRRSLIGRRVVVGDGALVGPDAVLADGCCVEPQALVAPHARLSPGAAVRAPGPTYQAGA
jgi:NDP-sugar pyrophosphorylase family protein